MSNGQKLVAVCVAFLLSSFIPATFGVIQPVHADSCVLTITPPSLRSAFSPPIAPATTGEQLVIAAGITSCLEQNSPFVAIVEVRNSNGITEQLGWQTGDFEGQGESGEIGVSWVPVNSGNYQLRVFAISSFEHPAVLSPVATSDVTVEENPSKAVVAIIPYDGEPSIHNAMFEPSVLTIVMGVNNTVVWTNGDNVSHRFVGETSFSDPSGFDGKRVFLYPGYSYEHVFTRAGLYQYADPDRELMHGIIWVIPRDALDAHLDVRISGLNDSYSLNEPIGFSADIRGFETGCGSFTITVERIDENRGDSPFEWSSGSAFFDCFDVAAPYRNIDLHFPPPEFESDYHLPIDRAGTYRLTATFEADYTSAVYSATREFLVN